ncbi:hypothetical protein TcasGA2_TC008626 [Tribolium castaneum]|uniref:Uncharacterized protein n=1 Tax=Tribolium castaneum TaxID=7070 RepID=D6WTJ3_TRICA|nr:hypothetical protein TcasGA2_TC008626 [Tribolium castaneum]
MHFRPLAHNGRKFPPEESVIDFPTKTNRKLKSTALLSEHMSKQGHNFRETVRRDLHVWSWFEYVCGLNERYRTITITVPSDLIAVTDHYTGLELLRAKKFDNSIKFAFAAIPTPTRLLKIFERFVATLNPATFGPIKTLNRGS